MIKFATKNEIEQIVDLWQEAFGDNRDWILMYLSENIDNVLIYEENGVVLGMLSLLKLHYKNREGYYVYGVATGKEHRSKGVSTKLLEFAKDKVRNDGFLVLVPRNQELFGFYQDRGFFAVKSVATYEISKEKAESDVAVFPATCQEYYGIRSKHFENLIQWDTDMLSSIKKLENGRYYKTEKGDGAFCCAYEGVLYVKELCGDEGMIGSIAKEYDVEKIRITRENRTGIPSCMTYPEFDENVFFNISID